MPLALMAGLARGETPRQPDTPICIHAEGPINFGLGQPRGRVNLIDTAGRKRHCAVRCVTAGAAEARNPPRTWQHCADRARISSVATERTRSVPLYAIASILQLHVH